MPNAYPAIDTAPEDAHRAKFHEAHTAVEAQNQFIAGLEVRLRQATHDRAALRDREAQGREIGEAAHREADDLVDRIERSLVRERDILVRKEVILRGIEGGWSKVRAAGYRPRVVAAIAELSASTAAVAALQNQERAERHRNEAARNVLIEAMGAGFEMPNLLEPNASMMMPGGLPQDLGEFALRRIFPALAIEALGPAA